MKSRFSIFGVAALFAFIVNVHAEKFPPVSQLPIQNDFPDALVMFDGSPVTTKKDWLKKRKPELKALFQHYEYGFFPPAEKIRTKVEYTNKNFLDGKATLRLVTISFGPEDAPDINLMVVLPNQRRKPTPVFLGMNFCGNHALVSDTNVPLSPNWINGKYPGVVKERATEASRGSLLDMWAIEQSINRGYAVATFHNGDVQRDASDAKGGVRDFF